MNNSATNSDGPQSNSRQQKVPQNRAPNQQHHSNRIYTRYNDQRPQYRKNHQQPSQPRANPTGGHQPFDMISSSQRQRQASSMSMGDASKMCICCWHELKTYVYYSCTHYVCLNCSIKMRVICEKIDCPVCRQESPRVLCTKAAVETSGAETQVIDKRIDRIGEAGLLRKPANAVAAGVYFDSESIRTECEDLLAYRCNQCVEARARDDFETMDELEKHIRKAHNRFYCELCTENLKLFPHERKNYDREGLARHKRLGDKDDLSFKGHPLCEYCDQRFFDKDALYRHFRKEHYYCHFCDTDGHEEYYKDYPQLRMHFLKSHYLCELDGCSANAAQTHEYVVFRTELDFQAHKKQKHAKTKSDARAMGKLNIEFNFSDSARDRQQKRRGRGGATGASNDFDSEDRDNYRGFKSRIETTDVDSNVLRASREQYEAEERERSRQTRLEAMREQHRKYEESMQPLTVVEEVKPAETVAAAPTPAPPPDSQPTSSLWRNLISGGNAPKINTEAEFPSLGGDSGPGKFMSLAELGASIATSSSRTNSAWAANKPQPAKTPKSDQKTSKKPHSPPKFSVGSDEEQLESKSSKKQGNKQKKKPTSNPSKAENDKLKPSEVVETAVPDRPKASNLVETNFPPPGFESFKPTPTSPPIVPGPPPGFQSKPEYIKPLDYEARNQELKSKLTELFDKKSFNEFMSISIDFRNSKLAAAEYLDRCESLLDFSLPNSSQLVKFLDLIQEMIVLLPNPDKQAELYGAFQKMLNRPVSWSSASNRSFLNAKVTDRLVKCGFCEQLFLTNEINQHEFLNHPMSSQKEEYPELVSSFAAKTNLAPTTALNSVSKKIEPLKEEFPPLGGGLVADPATRFSTLPTSSLFSNPSSHLSLANKKKHRLQK